MRLPTHIHMDVVFAWNVFFFVHTDLCQVHSVGASRFKLRPHFGVPQLLNNIHIYLYICIYDIKIYIYIQCGTGEGGANLLRESFINTCYAPYFSLPLSFSLSVSALQFCTVSLNLFADSHAPIATGTKHIRFVSN